MERERVAGKGGLPTKEEMKTNAETLEEIWKAEQEDEEMYVVDKLCSDGPGASAATATVLTNDVEEQGGSIAEWVAEGNAHSQVLAGDWRCALVEVAEMPVMRLEAGRAAVRQGFTGVPGTGWGHGPARLGARTNACPGACCRPGGSVGCGGSWGGRRGGGKGAPACTGTRARAAAATGVSPRASEGGRANTTACNGGSSSSTDPMGSPRGPARCGNE